MGRPPAYIFIVRHGNRLDAADKLWHLSSPTPYDPPLTYGGWTQSRSIGQRIGNILRDNLSPEPQSTPPASPSTSDGPPPKKRRYNVVIHSSPFLRCLQTSIAIAAGLATDLRPLEIPNSAPEPLSPRPSQLTAQNVSAVATNGSRTGRQDALKIKKTVMRIDAFLGEWLSPGYFELITPPPSSSLMLASAKAELLRREDYSSFTYTPGHTYSHSTSQLWGGASPVRPWDEDVPKSATRPELPSPRWLSLRGNGNGSGSGSGSGGNNPRPIPGGYVAPVPQFALSNQAQAPADYVAHARDACVELDYQWDSMHPSLDWGDGGEFGEEWTAMHRRFRKGLQHLVDWYTTTDCPTEPVTKLVHFKPPSSTGGQSVECAIEDDSMTMDDEEGEDEFVEESVVILVSHGAGCNAMIGAITQHPVLMDVGLSSLTAAARKPGMDVAPTPADLLNGPDKDLAKDSSAGSSLVHNTNGIVPLNKYYEMKLFASTEHLRSPSASPPVSRSSSIAGVLGGTRGRHSNSLSSALANAGFESGVAAHRSISAGSPYGNGRRPSGTQTRSPMSAVAPTPRSNATGGITVGSGMAAFSSPVAVSSPLSRASQPSIGLWSPVSPKSLDDELAVDDDTEILLSFAPEVDPATADSASELQPAAAAAAVATLSEPTPAVASYVPPDTASVNTATLGSGPRSRSRTPASLYPLDTTTGRGLWAAPSRVSLELEPLYDMTSAKRRWSVNERA